MNDEFLKLIFTIGFNTSSGIYYIPDPLTIREALIAPELDRDFANLILTKYQDIYPSADLSGLQKIMSLNSPDLWEKLIEELSKLEKYHHRLYALFSRHKFRREFVGEQPLDLESIASFVAWSNQIMKDIFHPVETSGRKYDVINNTPYIPCNKDLYCFISSFYCRLILSAQLKYLPSYTTIYKTRHKLFSTSDKYNKPLEKSNRPTETRRLEGETDKSFKNRRDKFRKKQNEEAQIFKTNQEIHNVLSRFTAADNAQDYFQYCRDEHAEDSAASLKRYLTGFVEELEDTESKRLAEQYSLKKSNQLNTEIVEIFPILSQCQFCYRYKIIEREKVIKRKKIESEKKVKRKKALTWHCDREECKNAYRAWVNDLNLKDINLEDLR